MMKLQLSGKRNNYTNLSFRAKQGGTERENRYSLGGGQASTRQKNMQQQSTKQIPSRQGDNKAVPSNPTERVPREQVWVVNVEAVTRAKKFKGEDTLTLAQRIRLNQERERERERAANCEQRSLIFELSCDKETTPAKLFSDATLVFKILQEKFAMETNSLH